MKVNNARNGKRKQPRRQQAKVIQVARPVSGDLLDAAGRKAAHMLFDPCGSMLEESVYGGERGFVNRFVRTGTHGTAAGQTASVFIYKPGNALAAYASVVDDVTSFAVSFGTSFPGQGYMNTNGTKCRAVSFCSIVRPVASPNNATGTIHFGILPASALPQGASTTVSALVGMLPQSVSVSNALYTPLEIKWVPGNGDGNYSPLTGITSDDDTDRNLVVIVVRGVPAASGVQYKDTAIMEWVPNLTSGIATDLTQPRSSRNDIDDVLRVLKQKDPNWWWSLGMKAFKLGKKAVAGYASGGIAGAAMRLTM